eukprot:7457553-Alexandrium_andersonii.AAC.1
MAEHSPTQPLNAHSTRKSGNTDPIFDSLASRRPVIRLAIATRADTLASPTSKVAASLAVSNLGESEGCHWDRCDSIATNRNESYLPPSICSITYGFNTH